MVCKAFSDNIVKTSFLCVACLPGQVSVSPPEPSTSGLVAELSRRGVGPGQHILCPVPLVTGEQRFALPCALGLAILDCLICILVQCTKTTFTSSCAVPIASLHDVFANFSLFFWGGGYLQERHYFPPSENIHCLPQFKKSFMYVQGSVCRHLQQPCTY